MNKQPIVIAVNGYPGSGKDTLCDFADYNYNSIKHSTVDTIKYYAEEMGWDGEKTPDSRNMLSAFKDFYTEWFDGPFKEMVDLITHAKEDLPDTDFIFMHIREPDEIKKIESWCKDNNIPFDSVLVVRGNDDTEHSNHADDNVTNLQYDYVVKNHGTMEEFEKLANAFFYDVIEWYDWDDEKEPEVELPLVVMGLSRELGGKTNITIEREGTGIIQYIGEYDIVDTATPTIKIDPKELSVFLKSNYPELMSIPEYQGDDDESFR